MDLEIPIPHYFISERSKELQERSTMLADMFKVEDVDESEKVSWKVSTSSLKAAHARFNSSVRLIYVFISIHFKTSNREWLVIHGYI